MRRILAEALIVALETALVLAIVAAFGVPGGKRTKAAAVSDQAGGCAPVGRCISSPVFDDFLRFGRSPPD